MTRAAATGALGAALVLCGLLFALPSLLVPGIALAILALAAAGWVTVGARGARLRLSAHPSSVQEGDPVAVRATAQVRRWSPPAELVVPSLGRGDVPGRGLAELEVKTCFERRGLRTLGPARASFRDPLGIAARAADDAFAEVLVLPRIEPVLPGRRPGRYGVDGAPGRAAGPELEFDLLRPHRPGSPASRIHWPTVARAGKLMERRLIAEADSRPLVVLDSAAPANDEALDRAVRAAASLCRVLASAGGCRILLPGDRKDTPVGQDLRAWPSVHARLAVVGPADAHPVLPRSVGASVVFWVMAARPPAPRALARSATAHRYLVAPGTPPQGRAAFTVAGCSGVRLELARARVA